MFGRDGQDPEPPAPTGVRQERRGPAGATDRIHRATQHGVTWRQDRRPGEWWPVQILPCSQELLDGLRASLAGQVLELRGFVAPNPAHHDRGVFVADGDRRITKELPKQPFKERGLFGALLAHEDQRGVRLAPGLERSSHSRDQEPSHHGRLHLSGLGESENFTEQLAHGVPSALAPHGLQIVLDRRIHAPRGHRVQRRFGHDFAGVQTVGVSEPFA